LGTGLAFRARDLLGSASWCQASRHGDPQAYMSFADFAVFRSHQQSLRPFGAYYLGPANVSGGDRPDRIGVARMTAEVFDVTGVHAMLGRTFTDADNEIGAPPIAVLAYSMWRDRFASDSGVIGKTVRVNDQA